MIVDAHVHLGQWNHRLWRMNDLIESMDRAGIDMSLLIPGAGGVSLTEAVEIARANPRIKSFGHYQHPNCAPKGNDALIQAIRARDICGVKFYLGYESYYPTDECLRPIYKLCQDEGTPVMFHTGVFGPHAKGRLKYAHPLQIDEVAAEFPDLKIVIAHLGNPWIEDCAAVVYNNANVYAGLSGFFTEFQSIAPDEAEDFHDRLAAFKEIVGSYERCVFGTDWPLYDQGEYVEVVRSAPMSEEESTAVFCGNALKLFGDQT